MLAQSLYAENRLANLLNALTTGQTQSLVNNMAD